MSEASTEIAPFSGDMEPGARREAIALWKHAQQLSRSNLAGELKGKPEDVYAVVAFASQFGINPGNAIQMVWIIKGRIVPRSEFLSAICRRAGHELRFEESSSERCTVAIRRRGDDFWNRITFTIEDAKRAKLTAKDIWTLFPADMLCHATVRRAVKRICPDVLLGVDLGGDEGIDARQYRPLDGADAEPVVDVEMDWDEDQGGDADEVIEDAEIVEDGNGGDASPADDEPQLDPAAERESAMKRLMVTVGKAFPEDDAPKGKKTARQKLVRRAAQYAVLKEHRSAADLTAAELGAVESWVYRHFLDEGATTRMSYEILDGDVVRFTLGDKTKDIEPAAGEAPAAA